MLNILYISIFSLVLSGCVGAMGLGAAGPMAAKTPPSAIHPTRHFVKDSQAWLCPTAEGARSAEECEGGTLLHHNQSKELSVSEEHSDLLSMLTIEDGKKITLYAPASAFVAAPDLKELDAFAAAVDSRYQGDERIDVSELNYVDLVARPKRYKGRKLVFRISLTAMGGREFLEDSISYIIPIPGLSGDKNSVATAQFLFKNKAYLKAFSSGKTGYVCGPQYCDEFVIVAEVKGDVIDNPQEGGLSRLPVLRILEMADRYGSYKTDG